METQTTTPTGAEMRQEMTRRKGKREQVLERLQQGGTVSNFELLRIGGIRYNARVNELRDMGHNIVITWIDRVRGETSYELVTA